MASAVYYKFKSQREESRVAFDGTGISVFDLKKEIILANNLKANDFDLLLFDSSTDQEFKDDSHIIPRSSSVVAKRLPPARPGKGKAAIYVANSTGLPSSEGGTSGGKNSSSAWNRGPPGHMSRRFDGKETPVSVKPRSSTPTLNPSTVKDEKKDGQNDEAAAMAAMFQAQTENWEETQEKMSHATRIYNNNNPRGGGRGGKPFVPRQLQHHEPARPLPPSYVCYRCGQKGHWIQDCPTNNDREYDNRPRIKRTTGIPRSFLKAVDQPSEGLPAQGVMVTPDGGYVVAQPDLVSWQKQVSRPKVLTAADIREKAPGDPTLACPIDNKLFRDAVKTPCCGTLFCEECIQTHLLENDFSCRNCSKKIPSLDKLVMDKPMRTKVGDYIDKAIKDSQKESDEIGASEAALDVNDQNLNTGASSSNDQEYTFDQQPGAMDMSQMLVDSIPQLQAQIAQISVMLQNSSLPLHVRQSTQYQHQQLQMELQQAQRFAALAAGLTAQSQSAPNNFGGMQGYPMQHEYQMQPQWTNNPFTNQQPAGQESAYQRLPINNRRRNLKRERPSDFLEIGGGEGYQKMPRYWE